MQLVVPLTALLGLLAFAGLTKIARPSTGADAVTALLPRRLRPATARHVLRVVGLGEVAIAGTGLASSTRVAGVLVAVAYAGLALIALRIKAVAPDASCGCVGGEAPVSSAHRSATPRSPTSRAGSRSASTAGRACTRAAPATPHSTR